MPYTLIVIIDCSQINIYSFTFKSCYELSAISLSMENKNNENYFNFDACRTVASVASLMQVNDSSNICFANEMELVARVYIAINSYLPSNGYCFLRKQKSMTRKIHASISGPKLELGYYEF